jgi:hypothetical protein
MWLQISRDTREQALSHHTLLDVIIDEDSNCAVYARETQAVATGKAYISS